MKIVYDNLEFLKKISRIRAISKRNQLLRSASTEEILALLEITINTLKFRVNMTAKQKERLALHADFLRKLSRKKSEKATREFIQSGEGGLLPALLIPIVAQAVASLISKNT